MTIYEAENQYRQEVADCISRHTRQLQKCKRIWIIIGSVLIIIGIVLTIIGFTTPPEVTSWGYEISTAALFERAYGIVSMVVGTFFVSIIPLLAHKSQKKGPDNFLPQIKNLYFNYLKCEDLSKDYKDFYKEKLEDIRNTELVNAVHRASAAASSAILFSAIIR